jgi:hypothetical protein
MRRRDTNDTKHKEVIDLLQNLPKVEAPENFEYNLRVKIDNGEFDTAEEPAKPKIFTSRTLFPSAAAIVTALILIFVFYNDSETPLNPEDESGEVATRQAALPASELPNEYIIKKKVPVKENAEAGSTSQEKFYTEDTYRVVVQPNDVVVEEKIDLPFSDGSSVNLDNFISGGENLPPKASGLKTVGTGTPNNSQYFNFNGFYIRKQMDDESLAEFKARIDSIRKLMNQFEKGRNN